MFQPVGFSLDIFQQRYGFTETESWQEAARREARQMAKAELPEKQAFYEDKFYEIISEGLFAAGGRISYNSGRNNAQLLNCFVLNDKLDSKEGWGNIAKDMVITSMTGGGCGIDFSDVRPNGGSIAGQKGTCPGPVSLMRLLDACAKPVKAGGQRRVALMFSLDLDHPDVLEFLDAKLEHGELTHANVSVRSKRTTEFIKAVREDADWELNWKGQFKKKIKAKDLWNKIVKNAHASAEPGFLNWELVSKDSNIYYIEELVTTNPCVAGDTEILTKDGYRAIKDLVGVSTDVWNGFEWSTVVPRITGHNRKMVTVTLSDGRSLRCTENHKWVIVTGYNSSQTQERISAIDLIPGQKLLKHEFPIVEGGICFPNAYTQGFISADGMDDYSHFWLYEPKFACQGRLSGIQSGKDYANFNGTKRRTIKLGFEALPKAFVPFIWDVKSRLDWLAGLLDGDGTELKEGGTQIASVDKKFLLDTQKLLTTLGVQSKVTKGQEAGLRLLPDGKGSLAPYECQDSYRLLIGAVQIQQLKKLGLKCERLSFVKSPNRDATQFVKIISVEESGLEDTVYCFTESKRNLGCFDGIVTGQCGEIALSSYDCCCLGHLVLPHFVTEDTMELDWHKLANVVRMGVRFLDNVLTVNTYPLPEMKAKSHNLRRIGLGTTGLADLLALLGLRYGSPKANAFCDKLSRFISKTAYESSILLAIEKGPFPACDAKKHANSGFMKKMPKKIRTLVEEHGIRNCAILTQAPVGTKSIVLGNCSSGLEPMFAPAYERRFWKDGQRQAELVFHPLFARFMKEGRSIEHFVGSHDLTVREHMEVQKIVQNHIDNAVSKTINMPENYTTEDMSEIWLEYLPFLKGTTFYRENSRGFYDEKTGKMLEPPLVAIPLEEAKRRFLEQQTAVEDVAPVDDCPTGVCEI